MVKRILDFFNLSSKGSRNELEQKLSVWKTDFVPPGHYYSPLNDIQALKKDEVKNFKFDPQIRDIDLRFEDQKELLQTLKGYYDPAFFTEEKDQGHRYYLNNNFFSYSDGIFLFCLLNHFKPKRIIEVGSGFSSALMLDVNEKRFDGSIELTFIEPFPEERLNLLLKEKERATVIKKMIQEVDLGLYRSLQANDVFFVDSSHVSKFKSDLNHIIFNVLPVLNSGVYIHFHDIFFPFEYPKEWILAGRAWNEIYLLRAFLMNNKDYEIILFPSMMEHKHSEWMEKNMPLTLKLHEKWPNEKDFKYYLSTKGQSIWLRKK